MVHSLLAAHSMELQNDAQNNQLRATLELVANPGVSSSRRRELEAWLDANSSVSAQHASLAVQHLDVANDRDSQLYWYYISSLERHAGRLFWKLDNLAKLKLLNDVFSLLNSCLHISSPLTRKVFSLHTTVLCWGASEQNQKACAALLELTMPPSDRYQECARAWQLQLEQCVVLMDDLQSGLLRSDACSAGVLPAACLTTLRGLFFSELQKRICGLALLAVKGATEDSRGREHTQQQQQAVRGAAGQVLLLGLDLLGKVLSTVSSAGTLPVTSTDLAEVCMTHLSSEIEDEAESALTAVNSICGLPMLPSERSALQQRLLVFLASSSDLTQRPLMRARVARAVIDNSGMNLLKLPQETCSVMHGLLTSMTEEARQRQSAQDVLCCLELWMLWLSRYADLSESSFQLDAAKQEIEWCIAPFRESARTLVRSLLRCLISLDEMSSAPAMAITAAGLNPESYTGAAMEEELSPLSIAETSADADLEYAAHLSDTSGAPVAPQSSEDLCAALSGHSTSEHGVFCACIENVVSHAVALCGPLAATEVWGCAAAALRTRGGVILSGSGPDENAAVGFDRERAALDVHVVARLASRCTHELNACDVGVVLGFVSTMVDWVTCAMQQLAVEGACERQRPVMIAVGAVFKALSALASLWVGEALHANAQSPDTVAQVLSFLSSLFELSVSTIHCVLITLPNSPHQRAPTKAEDTQTRLSEEAHHLASCASEALLAASHIAIGSTHLTQHDAVALRRSGAARALTDICMHLAMSPQAQSGLGSVPTRVHRDSWLAFSDMFAVWPSRVRDLPAEEWHVVNTDLRNALGPLLSAWVDVRTRVSTGVSTPATDGTTGGSSVQWDQIAGVFKRLCVCLASLLGCVGYLPKPARSCIYSAVEPAVEAALDVLEVAHRSGAHEVGLEGSRLMVAVVHSVLKEMPVPLVERMMSVSATAPQGSDALLAQQQVVRLVWRVTDEASNSVASLLPQAMSFLLTTLDGCTLEQLARFATFLEAAAAGNVASVHPQDLRELLEEFFDMQRVTGLYKREEFKQVRMLLEKGLMTMLLNPIADCAKEQLMDVLWGIGSTNWDEFVGQFLVQFCSICSELVQQRTEALVRPFTDQSGSLHDFPHFSGCMDEFVNDLRFFEKLAAAGAPPAKEE